MSINAVEQCIFDLGNSGRVRKGYSAEPEAFPFHPPLFSGRSPFPHAGKESVGGQASVKSGVRFSRLARTAST